ncbi:hypothetical protein GF362_04040 [Candidatus Dojkabacteria bacterium]|nr:hypothetical protein [Candidatus Dojkabacteria bacterium]
MTNSSQKNKTGSKSKALIITLVIIILVLCICAFCCMVSVFIPTEPETSTSITEIQDVTQAPEQYGEEYTGFKEIMYEFQSNLSYMIDLDRNMIYAASVEDPDAFFENYNEFQDVADETMIIARVLAQQSAQDEGAYGLVLDGRLINQAYAKERSSWMYYIPIIGSLIKAKHQSIETSRAGIYQYLKNAKQNDLEPVDVQRILNQFNLNDVEDIRNANDDLVERMARDHELRTSIDWTKVTTDLGKTAVETVVDANTALIKRENPITVSGFSENVVKDAIDDGKLDSIKDPLPKSKITMKDLEKRVPKVTIGISNRIKGLIDSMNPWDENWGWENVSEETKKEVTKTVIEESKAGPLVVAHNHEAEDANNFYIPTGNWDLTILGEKILSFTENFFIEENRENIINPSEFGLPKDFDPAVIKGIVSMEIGPDETGKTNEITATIEPTVTQLVTEQETPNITEESGCSLSGTWDTDWGKMTLTQSENSVTGNYEHDQGKIEGTFDGSFASGTWSEAPSYSPPTDAGKFEWTFTGCDHFEGKWGYGDDEPTGTWWGTKSNT